jgi:hypothetical protein
MRDLIIVAVTFLGWLIWVWSSSSAMLVWVWFLIFVLIDYKQKKIKNSEDLK